MMGTARRAIAVPTRGLVGLLAITVAASRAVAALPDAPPNFVVIVVDTLRADRLGAYGSARGLTPFLDRLAALGTVFTAAYAPSSWTCPSIASLFTSRQPAQHGVTGLASVLAPSEVTLAERLASAGYAAAGLSANFRLAAAKGYSQGFAFWGVYEPRPGEGRKARGSALRADVDGWLQTSWMAARRPALLYLQYLEPHAPYEAPAPLRERFAPGPAAAAAAANDRLLAAGPLGEGLTAADREQLAALYDAEVAAADEEIRLLFERLAAIGFLDNAVVVVTADHGEEFGEHGRVLHGSTLYEPAIRVPLLVSGSGIAAGRVVPEPVSLIDVAPTLSALAGLPPAPTFMGRSLVAALAAGDPPSRHAPAAPVVSELQPTGEGIDARLHDAAVVGGSRKLLRRVGGGIEPYDLAGDPTESRPQTAEAWPELVAALARVPVAPAPAAAPLDQATQERLRALGYRP
ncbi:MAG: sulfatase [Candidatus Binatia bacterium]